MRKIFALAAVAALSVSPALAQNHTPPAGSARALTPPIDQTWSQANPYGSRAYEGRSVSTGEPRFRGFENEQR
jgi:hypothetical protein